MKTFKILSIGLATLILFQNCVAYKKTSKSIEQIATMESRVRVVTLDHRVHIFKRIEKRDNQLYGVKSNKHHQKDVLLFPDDIKTIKVYDTIVSTLLTIFGSAFIISGFVVGITGVGAFYGN